MTTPVSVLPTVVAKIATALEALVAVDADAANIAVTIGDPAENDPAVIIDVCSDVRRTATRAAFIGGAGADYLEEVIDLDVAVSVTAPVVNGLDVDRLALLNRTWQIIGYVETAVRNDPSLGNTVVEAYPAATQGGKLLWSANRAGMICEAVCTVRITTLN